MSSLPSSMALCLSTAAILIQIAEMTRCLKRDQVENRDGNVYECLDPGLPVCCEMDDQFTCCEGPWVSIGRDQLWLFLVLAVLVAFGLCLCCQLSAQPHVFRYGTAREALGQWKGRLYMKFSTKPGKIPLVGPEEARQT